MRFQQFKQIKLAEIGRDHPWLRTTGRDPLRRRVFDATLAAHEAARELRALDSDTAAKLVLSRPADGGLENVEVQALLTSLVVQAIHDPERAAIARGALPAMWRLFREPSDADGSDPAGWSAADRLAALAMLCLAPPRPPAVQP